METTSWVLTRPDDQAEAIARVGEGSSPPPTLTVDSLDALDPRLLSLCRWLGAAARWRCSRSNSFGREDLLGALRETRLRGFDGARVYADATLELVESDPVDLAPAQRYVLRAGVAKILELRAALLGRGIDVFALNGGVWVRTGDAAWRARGIIDRPVGQRKLAARHEQRVEI